MGCGSSAQTVGQAEDVIARPTSTRLRIIDRLVTQTYNGKGVYCGEENEYLQKDRVDLEVYLKDDIKFVAHHNDDLIFRMKNYRQENLHQFLAHSIAMTLYYNDILADKLQGRFLIGSRLKQPYEIKMPPENPKKPKPLVCTVRVAMLGDSVINRHMLAPKTSKLPLAETIAVAERPLKDESAKGTLIVFDGTGKVLFEYHHVFDQPDAPKIANFSKEDIGPLISKYYKRFMASKAWEAMHSKNIVPKVANVITNSVEPPPATPEPKDFHTPKANTDSRPPRQPKPPVPLSKEIHDRSAVSGTIVTIPSATGPATWPCILPQDDTEPQPVREHPNLQSYFAGSGSNWMPPSMPHQDPYPYSDPYGNHAPQLYDPYYYQSYPMDPTSYYPVESGDPWAHAHNYLPPFDSPNHPSLASLNPPASGTYTRGAGSSWNREPIGH